MAQTKFFIHSHHIGSHFTNGALPVGAILLTGYFLSGSRSMETASYYCFIASLVASPIVFFSGFLDWKTRFMGRTTRIFTHKRIFGILFMLVSLVLVAWRTVDPAVAGPESDVRYLYLATVYIDLGFAVYLGHLGSKFI